MPPLFPRSHWLKMRCRLVLEAYFLLSTLRMSIMCLFSTVCSRLGGSFALSSCLRLISASRRYAGPTATLSDKPLRLLGFAAMSRLPASYAILAVVRGLSPVKILSVHLGSSNCCVLMLATRTGAFCFLP
jgi:hypothetical protein